MIQSIQEVKIPQATLDMRRLNSQINAISGKSQLCPLPSVPYSEPKIQAKNVARSFINLPVNRIFGFCVLAQATRQSNKFWMHHLADNNAYTILKDGVPVNDQRQLTNRVVAGLNAQLPYTTKERFQEYAGNAEAKLHRASMVKHSDTARLADVSLRNDVQSKDMGYNPLVVQAQKRSKEIHELWLKHSKKSGVGA